jgi:hypothetical protein
MRLIRNFDTRASSTRRQNPTQEVSAVNTIHPYAEINELFFFHDASGFVAGSAQGCAEFRQLILSSPMLEDSAGPGTAAAVKISRVEMTARAIPSTHLPRLTLL